MKAAGEMRFRAWSEGGVYDDMPWNGPQPAEGEGVASWARGLLLEHCAHEVLEDVMGLTYGDDTHLVWWLVYDSGNDYARGTLQFGLGHSTLTCGKQSLRNIAEHWSTAYDADACMGFTEGLAQADAAKVG